MKKFILPLMAIAMALNALSQPLIQCGTSATSINISGIEHVDFDPLSLTAETWADPVLLTDRRVFFIHGLGGEGDDDGSTGISWSQASLFSETNYMINSARPDYADISLPFAAMELKGDLEAFDPDDKSFIIAHSQGGIVSRQVDYDIATGALGMEPRSFYGLVTFGSPHQGARILNNRDELMDWVGTICTDLVGGPLAEMVEDNFFLDLFLDPVEEDAFVDLFCNSLELNIAPMLFKDYTSGITESYMVGSEQLATLNAFTPDIPYVCFYGEETEPVMWNTLVHAMPGREPNNTDAYGFEPFGATDDQTLTNYADVNTDLYFAKYLEYAILADIIEDMSPSPGLGLFFGIIPFGDPDDVTYIRDCYLTGYDFWVSANSIWKCIIGAEEYEETSWTCICDNEHEMDLTTTEYTIEPGESCDPDWGDCITTINYALIEKPNDGVVLAESASECLGQIELTPGFGRKMTGSNHLSMRNDENTEDKLKELFDGNHGNFFNTDER